MTADILELEEARRPADPDIALKGEEVEKARICRALEKTGGNRKEAARLLGISRTHCTRKWKPMGSGRKNKPQGRRAAG